jgi:hypothetical protein
MAQVPVSPFTDDISNLQGNVSQTRFIRIDRLRDYRWKENPKKGDVGSIWLSIAKNGYRDKAAWDNNLINLKGERGAFIYGNHRTDALVWGWEQKNPPPNGVLYDEAGYWYVPVEFGLDSASEAAATVFAVDHNTLTLLGGDYDIKGIMAMFDEKELAKIWQRSAEQGESMIGLDGADLDELIKFLDEPDFDFGGEGEGTKSALNGGMPDSGEGEGGDGAGDIPSSAIRMVQLFLNTVTIQEFSTACQALMEAYGTDTLTDTVMEAIRREAATI